ncbi:MAG: hypothetical protein HY293_06825 [Planctomycetes bacterium]|nr:hypothetical protein [Planctomycetota bacterium]
MRIASVTAVLLLLAACGRNDEVRHYKAPKEAMWRMLAALVPTKDATWFFKVVAPAERVGAHKDDVLSFLKSLRSEEGQVRWTLPAGWQEEKGTPSREASLLFGDRDPKMEMAISRLPGDAGGIAANVNRWRDQLGLEPAGAAEISSQLQKIAASGLEIHVADLRGPFRPAGGPKAMAPRPAEPPPPPSGKDRPVTFDLPAGWRENPHPSKSRVMEFLVEDPKGAATVSLTALDGEAGGLAANIDRWRTQVGLEPLGDQAVARSATPMTFVGSEAWLAEAIGAERGILGVIAIGPGGSLFLKMEGPAAVVAAQRSAFAGFAQSFKMRRRHE